MNSKPVVIQQDTAPNHNLRYISRATLLSHLRIAPKRHATLPICNLSYLSILSLAIARYTAVSKTNSLLFPTCYRHRLQKGLENFSSIRSLLYRPRCMYRVFISFSSLLRNFGLRTLFFFRGLSQQRMRRCTAGKATVWSDEADWLCNWRYVYVCVCVPFGRM